MTDLLLHNELVSTLGWAILHSLWQATLLAGTLLFVSRFASSAVLRYRLAFGTLLAQFIVSCLTFWWLCQPVSGGEEIAVASMIFAGPAPAIASHSWWQPGVILSWVVVFWLVGLAIGATRLAFSFGRVRGMQRDAERAVPEHFSRLVTQLANRVGYHGPLHLGISEKIGGPALVGHLKPMLLFPLAVINQLTPEQAEAVILHELAHLRRKDHWWNLLQCVIEVLFYYHPVVWWIGARIREEREHCCDDLVLRHGPDRLAYARALLYFEHQAAAPATAVALTNNPTGLLARVKRFLHQQNLPYQMKSRLFLLPLLALVALVSTAVYAPSPTDESVASAAETSPSGLVTAAPTFPAPATSPLKVTANTATIQPDTLPKGRHQVSTYRNGSSTKVLVEDQAIKELEIDGKVVPESEYDKYLPKVEQLLGTAKGDVHTSSHSTWMRSNGDGDEFQNLEDSFESLGLRWEAFGESIGEAGERLGERLDDLFDGDVINRSFHFDYDGNEDGTYFFDLDSLPPGSILELDEDGNSNDIIIRRSNRYSVDDLLEEVERERDGAPATEAEIEEMETMIERLERRKAQMRRDLERQRADGQRLEGDEQRLRRDAERVRRNTQRTSERSRRIAGEARRSAEGARRNAKRLAEEARSASPDYEAIISQLQKEGLVSDSGPIRKMMVDGDKLKINGEKASAAAHQRFLDLHEAKTGRRIGSNSKITITFGEF